MKVQASQWYGRPAIRLELEAADRERLARRPEGPETAVAWAVYDVHLADWSIPECQVVEGAVFCVPRFVGFVPPPWPECNAQLQELQGRLEERLREEGLL